MVAATTCPKCGADEAIDGKLCASCRREERARTKGAASAAAAPAPMTRRQGAVLLVLVGLVLAVAIADRFLPPSPPLERWEYQEKSFGELDWKWETPQKLGGEGWEIVASGPVATSTGASVPGYLLKRRVR